VIKRLRSARMCAVVVAVLCGASGSVLAQEAAPSAEVQLISAEDTADSSLDPLQKLVQEAIRVSIRRFLSADAHTPWQIMHGILALRQDYVIKQGDAKVSAIEFISSGAKYRGDDWFEKTRFGGRAHPYSGVAYAFEGHPNQFLAILSMADLPLDHQFKAGSDTITIEDMVEHAKMEVKRGEEITWTLWAMSHYLPPNTTWENKWGEQWGIERLVQMQTEARPQRAACGGTHGLFALSYARNGYLETGQRLRGVWIAADQKLQQYIAMARSHQNSDGTFSGDYFKGRQLDRNFKDRLTSSGHTLEFLMVALPQNRLDERWVRRGITAVSRELIDNKRTPADCGALYHAMNGLAIYLERTLPPAELPEESEVASSVPGELAENQVDDEELPGPDGESEPDGNPDGL